MSACRKLWLHFPFNFLSDPSPIIGYACHSLPNWLTDSCFVDLIDVTLACEDAYSKLVEVVTVVDVSDEDRVGNSLLHIQKLRFGHKAKLLFRPWAQGLIKILKLKFRQDLKLEFCHFFSAAVLKNVESKINLGRDSEARFGQDFEAQVLWRGWRSVEILKMVLGRDSEDKIWSRFVFELVIRTQPSGPLCLWQCLILELDFSS